MTAGGHIPVLTDEVIAWLVPVSRRLVVDCTLGLAGHSRALLAATPPEVALIGLDVDAENLAVAGAALAEFGPRARLVRRNFSRLAWVLQELDAGLADAVLADLGVSSNQISDPRRGLSFDHDGPLDMRLDPTAGLSAAELVNTLPEGELADLLYLQADEHRSRRIAKRICESRRRAPIDRTSTLARIVEEAVGGRGGARVHPATRTFLALRSAVNGEPQALERLLADLPRLVRPGGRVAIISFHSGEDRAVKRAFQRWSKEGVATVLTRKPVEASREEQRGNPRSRSAKLRVAERTESPLPGDPRGR